MRNEGTIFDTLGCSVSPAISQEVTETTESAEIQGGGRTAWGWRMEIQGGREQSTSTFTIALRIPGPETHICSLSTRDSFRSQILKDNLESCF